MGSAEIYSWSMELSFKDQPKVKETIDDVRQRMLYGFHWLDKAVAIVKAKPAEAVSLSIWMNADRTVASPDVWCGLDSEFIADGFVFKIPKHSYSNDGELPTYIVNGYEQITVAAVSEKFELYNVYNHAINSYHIFGNVGHSKYDDLIGDENAKDRFIMRVGLHKKDQEFEFERMFGEKLILD